MVEDPLTAAIAPLEGSGPPTVAIDLDRVIHTSRGSLQVPVIDAEMMIRSLQVPVTETEMMRKETETTVTAANTGHQETQREMIERRIEIETGTETEIGRNRESVAEVEAGTDAGSGLLPERDAAKRYST